MAVKKKAGKKANGSNVKVNRKPRTPRLPGMEDAGIPELEDIAEELGDVQAHRIKLSKREGELQEDLLRIMRKHHKTEYHHEEVHAWVTASEFKVKVTIGELRPAREKKMKAATASVKELEKSEEPKSESESTEAPSERSL